MRAAVRAVLAVDPELEIVAETGTAAETIDQAGRTSPDVVLLDVNLPDRRGIGIISDLLAVAPQARVLVLTMHEEPSYLRGALKAGARGYLLKESTGDCLATAIRDVLAGYVYIDSSFHAHHTWSAGQTGFDRTASAALSDSPGA